MPDAHPGGVLHLIIGHDVREERMGRRWVVYVRQCADGQVRKTLMKDSPLAAEIRGISFRIVSRRAHL